MLSLAPSLSLVGVLETPRRISVWNGVEGCDRVQIGLTGPTAGPIWSFRWLPGPRLRLKRSLEAGELDESGGPGAQAA